MYEKNNKAIPLQTPFLALLVKHGKLLNRVKYLTFTLWSGGNKREYCNVIVISKIFQDPWMTRCYINHGILFSIVLVG